MMDLVEVIDTEKFGKALVATKDIKPGSLGFEIFREEALVIFPPYYKNNHHLTHQPPWGNTNNNLNGNNHPIPERAWSDYLHYKKLSKDVQTKVLSLYADDTCNDAIRAKEFLQHQNYFSDAAEKKDFIRLLMIIKFNAVQITPTASDGSGEGKCLGHGLFEIACRMSHSCWPNACWFSTQDGRYKIIRALKPIKAGEMITIFYLDQRLLEKPIWSRRQDLFETKNFICQCTRCCAEGDDMRRIPCCCCRNTNKNDNKNTNGGSSCEGYHLIRQATKQEEPLLLPCTVCKEVPNTNNNQTTTFHLLQEEMKFCQADKLTELGDPAITNKMDRILALQPPHPYHGIALRVYRAQSELYEHLGQIQQAAECQQKWITCRQQLHGNAYQDQRTGFGYERLGELSERSGNLPAAAIAYQSSIRALQVCRGDSTDPLTLCSMKKFINVQQQQQQQQQQFATTKAKKTSSSSSSTTSNNDDNHNQKKVCGLCGIHDDDDDNNNNLKLCTRCKLVSYCNRDHQVMHWKVHKKSCCSST